MLNSLQNYIINSISTDACCGNAFLSAIISLTYEKISQESITLDCPEFLHNKIKEVISNFYPMLKIDIKGLKFIIYGYGLDVFLQELGIADFNSSNIAFVNGCNDNILLGSCCKITYLKTVFLCVGKIYYNADNSVKTKGYSLEFTFKDYQLADDVFALTKFLEIKLKMSKRGNNVIIYSKDSQVLVEFLVKIGASEEAFELQNNLVMREIRNDANRKGNCFDANLNKTITASSEQVHAIDYIIQTFGLDYLDENLREVALLRLSNPESTLSELQTLYSVPITRSGLKYKLDKILGIYKQLKK